MKALENVIYKIERYSKIKLTRHAICCILKIERYSILEDMRIEKSNILFYRNRKQPVCS